jgi:hypothetical protein
MLRSTVIKIDDGLNRLYYSNIVDVYIWIETEVFAQTPLHVSIMTSMEIHGGVTFAVKYREVV